MKPWPEKERQTVSISRKLAWGAGTMSIIGAFGIVAPFYARFYSREEGIALDRNVIRIEKTMTDNKAEMRRVVDDTKNEVIAKLDSNQSDIEKKIDKVLQFMQDGERRSERANDRQDRQIENLELYVLGKPKGK